MANSTALLAVHTAARGSMLSLIPVSMFVGSGVVLYYYGQRDKSLIWSSDSVISTRWHSALHIGNGILGVWLVFLIK